MFVKISSSFHLLLLAQFLVPKRSTSILAHKSSSEFFQKREKRKKPRGSASEPITGTGNEERRRNSNPQETLGEYFSIVDKEEIRTENIGT